MLLAVACLAMAGPALAKDGKSGGSDNSGSGSGKDGDSDSSDGDDDNDDSSDDNSDSEKDDDDDDGSGGGAPGQGPDSGSDSGSGKGKPSQAEKSEEKGWNLFRLRRKEQELASTSVKSGKAQPLRSVIAHCEKTYKGKVLDVKLRQKSRGLVYEIRMLTKASFVRFISLDAKSLRRL